MENVTGAYLDGIADARQFLKTNPDLTLEEMEACLNNAKVLVRCTSFAMKDFHKGERDFWKNQIAHKKGQTQ